MQNLLHIEAVNFESRIALLTDGRTVPITNFFGEEGEVDDYLDATSFVCGEGSTWFACPVDVFEEMTLQ